MSKAPPPELLLAAACCGWPIGPAQGARIVQLAGGVADWPRFAAIVHRNRIGPLVHHALNETRIRVPEEVSAPIASRAVAAGWQAVTMAAESLRLQQAFDGATIPAMILKGVPLSMLAYGRLGLKEARDIDLLVPRHLAEQAVALLRDLGYACKLPVSGPAQIAAYLALAKELEFVDPSSGIMVELHWHLTDSTSILPGVGAEGPAQEVPIAQGTLRTLPDRELFGYLCAHGTAHNWNRLKWLADLGALLTSRSDAQVEDLYEATQAQGTRRAANVALMLCERLLGFELGNELSRTVRADAVARALHRNAIGGLDYRGGGAEYNVYSRQWLRVTIARFRLAPGAAHFREQVSMMWSSPLDRARFPLPKGLGFLYHAIRIPLWLVRHARRIAGRENS